MVELIGWDMANKQRVMRGGYIAMKYGTDGLVEARNKTVRTFLDEHNADWLFWIDTDMGFAPDTIDRLLEVADPESAPIVGGLCFTQREEQADNMGGWRCRATPTVFDWTVLEDGQQGFSVRWNYTPDAPQRCAGTGSACVLIHRSVFEKIEAKYGPVWYDRIVNKSMNRVVSEDLSLCMRAGALELPLFVHTGVKTTHMKTTWLCEDDYFGQVALAQMPPEVPAATEETAVIVPVLGRPQNASPFMLSLAASGTDLAKVYAVADHSDQDTAQAWADAGAEVILYPDEGKPGTFAEKVNYAYKLTREPWLFLVGDDVRFQQGWLDHAQQASRDGAHVIGTNDLHNPRVVAGEHATHLLVRRAYVDERGASLDGPGVVLHEGYGHWFCDDEAVTVAKDREVWAFAPGAKVEHLHPLWGLAEMDDTYRIGADRADADRALFESRFPAHA